MDRHQISSTHLVLDNRCTFGGPHPFSLQKGSALHRLRWPFRYVQTLKIPVIASLIPPTRGSQADTACALAAQPIHLLTVSNVQIKRDNQNDPPDKWVLKTQQDIFISTNLKFPNLNYLNLQITHLRHRRRPVWRGV